MQDRPLQLVPGRGLDALPFGASKADVRAVLGEPDSIVDDEIPGWTLWQYPAIGLDLAFDGEADDRLITLRSEGDRVEIAGQALIGLDRAHLIGFAETAGWPEAEVDWDGDGEEFDFPDLGLMFWLEAARVVAISASALVDDADHDVFPGDD